ncbi:MAG: hypothetical protein WB816_03605 [Methylocystis sp.]
MRTRFLIYYAFMIALAFDAALLDFHYLRSAWREAATGGEWVGAEVDHLITRPLGKTFPGLRRRDA